MSATAAYQLRDCVFQEGALPSTTEDYVLESVRVLGPTSQNRRRYTPQAVTGALPLYEGVLVNTDHPDDGQKRRPVADRFGWLEGLQADGAGGIKAAKLRINPEHPLAKQVMWWARHQPRAIGLSHDAVGDCRTADDGTLIVERITSVRSVDLVADPATTRGLYESIPLTPEKTVTPKTIKALLSEGLPAKRPGYHRGLKEMDDAGMGDVSIAPPPDEPAEDEGKDHEQALKDAAKAVIDDDDLTPEEKIAKIKAIFKVLDGGKKPPKDDEPDEEEAKESLLRVQARDACADAGVIPGKILRRALDSCKSLAEAKELIEEAKGQQKPPSGNGWQQPTSAGKDAGKKPLKESQETPPADPDKARAERVAALRRPY